jgi:hypothetical protein
MSARGSATLYIYKGFGGIAGAEPVHSYVEDSEPLAGLDDAGVLYLEEINWLEYTTLVAEHPDAVWECFMGPGCEDSDMYFGYHKDFGMMFAVQIDHVLMTGIKSARTQEGRDRLARLEQFDAAVQAVAKGSRQSLVQPQEEPGAAV